MGRIPKVKLLPCVNADCDRMAVTRGYCMRCYARARRSGELEVLPVSNEPKLCSVLNCDRTLLAKGLCSLHWQRQYRHDGDLGDLTYEKYSYSGLESCLIEDCDKPPVGRGWCSKHWERWSKWGDPMVVKQAANGEGTITRRRYRMVTKKGHPLANASGHVLQHRMVLYDAIGPGEHSCHWCERMISWDKSWPADGNEALIVDHLDKNRLNNAIDNLVPSCQSCNIGRVDWATRWVEAREDGKAA